MRSDGHGNGLVQVPYELETQAPVVGQVRPMARRKVRPDPWPKPPDLVADAVDAGHFRMAAASLLGAAHASAGSCRQDAYGFGADANGTLYFVVADGLGSRAASHLGAAIFCESVLLHTANSTSGSALDPAELVTAASERTVRVAASVYGLSTTDILCVALVGVLSATDARLARVGDATAFLLRGTEFIEVLSHENQLVNLVDATVPGEVTGTAEVVTAHLDAPLAVVTDGLATDIRTSPAVQEWLSRRWSTPLGPHAMADSLRYRRQGSHDDRTAVVVWPAALDPSYIDGKES